MYIYLDSYNFSNISSGLCDLPRSIREGRAKFVYTLSRIIEALPKNEHHVEDSIKRIRLIMGDRYGVPGRSFSELRDIVRYSGKKVTIEDLICNKEDLLTTEFGIEQFDNFETNFKSRIQEMLQTIPDINERRKKRAFLIKHGKLRRGDIFPLMKNHSEQLLASAEKELPELAPLFSDGGMIEYMAKKN